MASTISEPRIEFLERPLRLYIDGAFVETDGSLATVNPATGATLAEAPLATEREVDAAVGGRGPRLRYVAVHPRDPASPAHLDARRPPRGEQGRVRDDRGPRQRQADVGGARRSTSPSRSSCSATTPAGRRRSTARSCRTRSPGCSPWRSESPSASSPRSPRGTSPCSRSAYKLGPALAAGCTIVIKPSELAPLSTLRLMELVDEAGFPPGVVNVVIGGPDVGAALVRHPGVQKVAFTGQTATGKEIMRTAVDGLKRVTLELGGKSPNIVFADANLDAAASGAFGGIFFNQGQACVAGSRLFVEASVADELVARVSEQAGAIRLGSGLDPDTQMGPLISSAHRTRVKGYVACGARAGRRRRRRGRGRHGRRARGWVLLAAHGDQRCSQRDEGRPGGDLRAGPLRDRVEGRGGVALARQRRGLRARVGHLDVGRQQGAAPRGSARCRHGVDQHVRDVRRGGPLRGRKHSGFGKELGEEALEPYLHSKSVWVDLTSAVPQSGQGISR